MAFGTHWEWRGFGRLPTDLAERIRAAGVPVDVGASTLADRYLYAPGGPDNVKLRDGQLKVKRFVAPHAPGIELWREDEGEIFDFPLDGTAMASFCEALACRPTPGEHGWAQDPDRLLTACAHFDPPVRHLDVVKRREQLRVRHRGVELLVEISRVESPERIDSVSIEGPPLDACSDAGLDRSLDALASLARTWALAETLRPRNYLEMIGEWLEHRRR